jgi:tetratricopeptide (TPR) repeat protein
VTYVPDRKYLTKLRQLLTRHFNEEDLRTLCFDMDIEYDALPGRDNAGKARELVARCDREGCIPELVAVAKEERPNVDWDDPQAPKEPEIELPPPPASTPRLQLRPPVDDFVGRDAESARLVVALRQTDAGGATAIIRGMGGLGKTELAYRVAHAVADAFPDAQLLIELHGASDEPLTPERALLQVIQTFDPEAQPLADLTLLEARYRATLAGKRVLLLADDAADAEQVRRLQPPACCALLITSRSRFTLPGATLADPESLTPDEAAKLLRSIHPEIDADASRLAALCGYLPLALRVSASLLANGPWSVAGYLKRLADERERLQLLRDPDDPRLNVEASLNLSYFVLNDAGQRVLTQISVFRSSFNLSVAKAVVSMQGIKPGAGDERALKVEVEPSTEPDTAQVIRIRPRGRAVVPKVEVILDMLYRRSLIRFDPATERYSLHDLVRLFAAERLKDVDTHMRYVRYYLQVARQAQDLYKQGHAHVLEGLALFDQERGQIDAAWEWLRQSPPTSITDGLLIEYAYATAYIGDLRYHQRRERIPQLEAALEAARRLRRKQAQGAFIGNLGIAYRILGEVRRSVAYHQRALEISRGIGNRHGEGNALGNLGNAYFNLGEVRHAITLYQQALEISREIGDRHSEGNSLGSLGNVYLALGEVQHAIPLYQQALDIRREIGDRNGEASSLSGLGNAYLVLGEVQHAIPLYQQALDISRQIGDRNGEGNALSNLGNVYFALGEIQRAISLREQALDISREIGDRSGEAIALSYLGWAYIEVDEIPQAITLCEQALAIKQEIGDRSGESDVMNLLGLAYAAAGEPKQARKYHEQALAIARETEAKYLESRILNHLGEVFLQSGDLDGAEECCAQSHALAQKIEARQIEAHSSWNLGLIHERRGELARAAELLQVRVAYEREIGHTKAEERAAYLEALRQRGV